MIEYPSTLDQFRKYPGIENTRVYLAGPMRGKTREDMAKNFAAFAAARTELRKLGLIVFCPAERDEVDNGFDPLTHAVESIGKYMADDLPEVCRADAVVVLPGWWESQGARCEAVTADLLGKPVYRYSDGTLLDMELTLRESRHCDFISEANVGKKMVVERNGEYVCLDATPELAAGALYAPKIELQTEESRKQNFTYHAGPATGEQRATDSKTGGEKCFKPERFEFIPVEPMREVARVYGYGATKYADRNWERGYDWGLSYGALQRHLHEFWAGRSMDPESKCHHLAHAVFHCLAMLEWERTHPELDSRPGRPDRVIPEAPSAHQAGTK